MGRWFVGLGRGGRDRAVWFVGEWVRAQARTRAEGSIDRYLPFWLWGSIFLAWEMRSHSLLHQLVDGLVKANKSKVGIRIRQRSGELYGIQALRGEYCKLETKEMLGRRKKSNNKFNAFGFSRFQPHITFLKPGNRLNPDLYPLGADFRGTFKSLRFDRLVSREVDPIKTNGTKSINSQNKPDKLGDSWSELNKIKLA